MFRKYISLASSRIKHYAFHNALIFAMFMFGITISAIAFIFFYGNSMVDKQNEARNALSYRTFIIHSTNQLNQEILKKLSNLSTSVLDVRVKCEIENPFISHVHEAMTPQPLNIISLVKNNNAIYSYQGKNSFTKEELHQNVAIIPMDYGEVSSILLEGNKFTVVGRTTNFDLNIVFIPLHAFLTNGFNQSSIEVILDSVPSRHTNNKLLRQISELLPDAVISDPFELIQADQSKNLEGIVLSSGVFLISILSFLSLFQYLVSENSYENAVYSIVGADNKSVIIITLFEIIILSSAAAFIACIVYVTCYDLLFVKINIYGSIRYSIYDYLVCFVLEILISFAAVLPFVCFSSTHSLVEMERRFR